MHKFPFLEFSPSPTELAVVSANEVELKGYQITSFRKKGAPMKFYEVAWAQGVYFSAPLLPNTHLDRCSAAPLLAAEVISRVPLI